MKIHLTPYHRLLTRIFFVLIVGCIATGSLISQTLRYISPNTIQYTPHTNFPGARAAGFADAFVSDAYDVTCMYWNPAALAYLRQMSVIATYSQERIIRGMEEDITFPLRVMEGEGLSAGLSANNVGYFGTQSKTPFRALQYAGTIAYAKEIIPALSVGASALLQYGQSDVSKLWTAAGSIGVFYAPDQQLSYGASFSGIGSGMLYETSDHITTTLVTQNLPHILSMGASVRFPENPNETVLIISAANSKLFGESGIRYNGGAELWLVKFLALRGGYIVHPNLSAARFGMGLRFPGVEFDSAISPSKSTDQAVHFSFAVDL